jgi:flagellar hook assembly protein FlgD
VRTDQKATGYLHCRPNPFTRATNVAFQILEPSDFTLAVYDISGKRVRTLVTGHPSCGFREVAWNGEDDSGSPVPAGTYFCRLSTSGHSRIEAVRLLE